MVLHRPMGNGLFSLAIGAIVLLGSVAVSRGDAPEPPADLPQRSLPLPPAKAMPPRQCLPCGGPAAAAPCFDTHRGFLYYGTYPWDDDPYNEFDDCPGGRCGYPGAMLSLWWIKKHQTTRHHRHRADHRRRHAGQCSHCQGAALPTAPLPTTASEHSAGSAIGGGH